MVTEYDIWDQTLDFMEKDIQKLSPTTMVTIVPFQGTVYDQSIQHCPKSDFSWKKFKDVVYDYPKTLTGTNICSAWDRALNYVDPNKDNYLYLLTDGRDNKNPSPDGTENVCKRIREWCEKVRNTRGYFVMLSDEAADPRIKRAVEECLYMYWTDASKELKPFGSFEKDSYNYNTLEPQDVSMPFSAEGEYHASVKSDNPAFDVQFVDNGVKDGKATMKVTPKRDLSTLPDAIDVPIVVSSEDIDILNDTLHLIVKNLPERSLTLPDKQRDLGESEYYDSFLWVDAKNPDTLTFDLQPRFNEAAIAVGSYVDLKVVQTTELDSNEEQCEILLNNQKCENGVIRVEAGKPAILKIIPMPSAEDGKHYYDLCVDSRRINCLENINQEHPSDYVGSFRYDYDVRMNPLKVFLIWLTIVIISGLLLWFIMFRPFLYPKITVAGIQVECEPTFRTLRIRGCRKVVFSNKAQRQSFINKVFTGEVKYVKDECWDAEWYVLPSKSPKKIKAMNTTGYNMNPPGTSLALHETVQMKSVSTRKVIKITIV